MTKIKVLAILAVVVLLALGSRDFVAGWQAAYREPVEVDMVIKIPVMPDGMPTTTLEHKQGEASEQLLYEVNSISVYLDRKQADMWGWIITLWIVTTIAGFAFFYGIYCLIRLIIAVVKGEVFNQKNIRRIRWFAYTSLVGHALIDLMRWLEYEELASQIHLPHYEVMPYSPLSSLVYMVVIALLAEIFVAAVKIKEEQDLTI